MASCTLHICRYTYTFYEPIREPLCSNWSGQIQQLAGMAVRLGDCFGNQGISDLHLLHDLMNKCLLLYSSYPTNSLRVILVDKSSMEPHHVCVCISICRCVFVCVTICECVCVDIYVSCLPLLNTNCRFVYVPVTSQSCKRVCTSFFEK